MWGRWCEVLCGVWLLACAAVLPGAAETRATDVVCGVVAIALALLSFVRRFQYAHLASLAAAAWLCVNGWLQTRGDGQPPAAQNEILTGLLLATFALVPSDAFRPPLPWRDDPAAQE